MTHLTVTHRASDLAATRAVATDPVLGSQLLSARPISEADASAMLDEFTAGHARRAFGGVRVAPDTAMPQLGRRAHLLTMSRLLGPAALLACPGGRYADPSCSDDLFVGWQAAYDLRAALPAPLRIAAELGETFPGTVAELAHAVSGILAEH